MGPMHNVYRIDYTRKKSWNMSQTFLMIVITGLLLAAPLTTEMRVQSRLVIGIPAALRHTVGGRTPAEEFNKTPTFIDSTKRFSK